jgi:tetratricopeptide (TPR) repeat protein
MAPENLLLTWNPVPGATAYQVQIKGRGVAWAVEVGDSQVTFPDRAGLQPNYRYAVVITADNRVSSGNGPPVGFTVLPAAEVERVKQAVEQIQAQGLELDIEAISLAMLYLDYKHSDPDWRSYALNYAALQVLAARIEAGTENPTLYLLQAEAYLASGLPLLARASYEQALALGQRLQQREIQAKSQVGLGEIAAGQTDYPGAIAHLQAAQTLYGELGDRQQVGALQNRISTLEKERP